MGELPNVQSPALDYALAMAIGFLVGRTREPRPGQPQRPGIRDFVIIAISGAFCAHIGITALTIATLGTGVVVLLSMRFQHPERPGITTELAAITTFLLGYGCMTPLRAYAAAMAIVLSMLLATKEELRHLVLEEISEGEYRDTLRFLGLIFVIYPILPLGHYGPFGFFDPRRIWFFIVLVSGVSFVGYFMAKFLGPAVSIVLGALMGGLASTTAYTGGVSRVVRDSPGSAQAFVRATLLSNTVLAPRILVVMAAVAPTLALLSLPTFGAMTIAGLLSAWVLGMPHNGPQPGEAASIGGFKNPFTLGPALKLGLIFTAVLFVTRAGQHFFGATGMLTTAAIGGLVDVDAVLLTLSEFYNNGIANADHAILGMLLAVGVNAIFKSALAETSRSRSFFVRILAGFVIMQIAGFAGLYGINLDSLRRLFGVA